MQRKFLVLPAALLACSAALAQTVPGTDVPALAPSSGAIIMPGTPLPQPTAWTVQQMDAAFARADRNRDGSLSRAEAQVFTDVRLNFEELDGNKDGSLSRAEFEKGVR